MKNKLVLLFFTFILQCSKISAQYDVIYTDGPIWFQFLFNYDLGKQIELHNLDAGYGWDSGGSTNATCEDGLNGTNTGLQLFKGSTLIHDFGIECSGTHGWLDWPIPNTLTPGNNYRFKFYYDYRPTSSCCAAYYQIVTPNFTIGKGPDLITPENGETYPEDLTFEWNSSPFDDSYRLQVYNDPEYSHSCSSGTVSGTAAIFIDNLLDTFYHVPEAVLEPNTTYNYIVTAKQFGLCFSEYGIFTTEEGLPVELINFDAAYLGNQNVLLAWKTASEENNDYYTIQRSDDGIRWEDIKNIPSVGNSFEIQNYSVEDHINRGGTFYYKLIQTDFDGSRETVDIVSLQVDLDEISIYPNPSIGILNVEYSEPIELSLYDIAGRLIILSPLNTQHQINTSYLLKGIYMLSIRNNVGGLINSERVYIME